MEHDPANFSSLELQGGFLSPPPFYHASNYHPALPHIFSLLPTTKRRHPPPLAFLLTLDVVPDQILNIRLALLLCFHTLLERLEVWQGSHLSPAVTWLREGVVQGSLP